MLKLTMQKVKWISIYIVGVIAGLFAGANLLGGSIGLYLCKHINGSECSELGELNAYLYAGLIGIGIFLLVITIVRKWLNKKTAGGK